MREGEEWGREVREGVKSGGGESEGGVKSGGRGE